MTRPSEEPSLFDHLRSVSLKGLRTAAELTYGTTLEDKIILKAIYYHILDKIVDTTIEPRDWNGHIVYVNPTEHIAARYLAGKPYEERVKEFLRARVGEGEMVVDIGAQWGFHALLLLTQIGEDGELIAIEPHPVMSEALERTVARNGYDNVTVHSVAASNETGRSTLYAVSQNTGASSLHDTAMATDEHEVGTIPLDDLLRDVSHVDFVKVDVEGAEHLVLERAPLGKIDSMLVEIHPSLLSRRECEMVHSTLIDSGRVVDIESMDPVPDPPTEKTRVFWQRE